jgi:hypothetical protein
MRRAALLRCKIAVRQHRLYQKGNGFQAIARKISQAVEVVSVVRPERCLL